MGDIRRLGEGHRHGEAGRRVGPLRVIRTEVPRLQIPPAWRVLSGQI
jgi:hypothetical protein